MTEANTFSFLPSFEQSLRCPGTTRWSLGSIWDLVKADVRRASERCKSQYIVHHYLALKWEERCITYQEIVKKTVENEELAFTSYFLTRKNIFKGFYGNTPVPIVYWHCLLTHHTPRDRCIPLVALLVKKQSILKANATFADCSTGFLPGVLPS